MAGNFHDLGKDSLDITELASLNDDISDDLISQLQQQISDKITDGNKSSTIVNENDDSTLFEETSKEQTAEGVKSEQSNDVTASSDVSPKEEQNSISQESGEQNNKDVQKPESPERKSDEKKEVNQNFDDNFIKKYKAKLKNKAMGGDKSQAPSYGGVAPDDDISNSESVSQNKAGLDEEGDIGTLSQGNITERKLTGDVKNYNDSLDFLDKNVKYSKYVIYIDPQNVDFIDRLTVRERKNLINGILRQQDDIEVTKLRFKVIQTIIINVIISVLTVAISIPVVYHIINASLEATINNHRSAQTNWQVLYKEHGKITQN